MAATIAVCAQGSGIKDNKDNNSQQGNQIKMVSIIDGANKAEADSAYSKEEYDKAAQIYESILAQDGEAPELYYNLANCYYKMDKIALAVLNYERANKLNPGDSDIRTNLALARGKTIDKVTPPSEMFFVTWARNIMYMFAVDTWAKIGVVAFALMIVLALIYVLMNDVRLRKAGFFGALLMLLVVIVANVSAAVQKYSARHNLSAIVISPSVAVKSSPSNSSTDLFLVHEGTKLMIEDNSMSGWVEVKLEEGKIGWIPVETIEVI